MIKQFGDNLEVYTIPVVNEREIITAEQKFKYKDEQITVFTNNFFNKYFDNGAE